MKTKLNALALGVLLAPTAFGQFQYEQLKSFPQTGAMDLIEGGDGALYGTTSPECFTTDEATFQCFDATVFRLNRDGSGYLVLHRFTETNGDVARPTIVSLLEVSDGALYGATWSGGPSNVVTIFKLNKDGSGYTEVLRTNGTYRTTLAEGSDGVLYGTTETTVFKLNKNGSGCTVLRVFTGADGIYLSPLLEGTDGALYGTALYGGTNGNGNVFKLNKDGSSFAVIRDFTSIGDDGRFPSGRLIEGGDGALYGTTANGGTDDWGTVFKLNKDGSDYTILHSSSGSSERGEGAPASLVEGDNGVLYGIKFVPCRERCLVPSFGTVFTLKTDGSGYAVLHSFTSTNMVIEPSALIKGRDGALYGATWSGHGMNLGTIFTLRPQPELLPPMVSMDSVIVRFKGLPGSTNQVQRTGTLGGEWLTLTNLVSPTRGVVEFTDEVPPRPNAFYRVVQVR